jgi:hypothetical protein
MNKRKISVIAGYIIGLILLNVIFWGIPFEKGGASYIAYVFLNIAVVVALVSVFLAFGKNNDSQQGREMLIKSKLYGFPVFRVGYIYLVAQIVITVAICIAYVLLHIQNWISLVCSMVALLLALLGLIVTDNVRDEVEHVDRLKNDKTKPVYTFRINIDSYADRCKNTEIKKKMEKLAEEFKYSDPVSNEELVEIENDIKSELGELDTELSKGNKEILIEKIDKIERLLSRRNDMCRYSKIK